MEDLLVLVSQALKGNIDWHGIGNALSSFVIPMSRTEQNPVFHAEGDVWTHTKMVCQTLLTLDSFRELKEEAKKTVFLAALLHDIGKISTTRWEDGKWTSPNHTLVGSKMARRFLWMDKGLCGTPEKQHFRETVCNLIRYHSFPPHAIDAPDGKRKLMSIAANGENCPGFTIALLCVLCEADALGRMCTQEEERIRMLEQVQICQEFAKENGCFTEPFPFPSAHTRYCYLASKEIAPEIELYDDTWGEVILMSGLPGTGKDTWIKENYPHLPMVSLDAIRKERKISPMENQGKVVEIAREQAREFLRNKQPFIWNATNLSPAVRKRQINLFTQYGASARIICLETNWQEQLRRNAGRKDTVPEQVICDMMGELVLPEAKEAHRVDWICM